MSVASALRAAERVGASLRAISPLLATGTALAALLEAVVVVGRASEAEELARRCGRSRRSLCRDLRAAGLPPPSALLAWGQVLVAVALLEDRRMSIERAALAVGLSGSAALVHLCRRHVGPTPGALRARGGLQCAIGHLEARIATNRRDRHG